MKKTISLLLIIFVMGSMFLIGCGKKSPTPSDVEPSEKNEEPVDNEEKKEETSSENFNPEGFPIVDEKIELTMMGFRNPIQGPWNQLKFFNKMEEMTNISFAFDNPPHDGYDEKKNLAFASGEYPDVFFGGLLSHQEEVKYGESGILIPLEELIEQYAPNIQKMFEEMPDVKQSITAPDGHIYALPNINKASIAVCGSIWVNKPWLDNLDIDANELPDTVEDLYGLLKRFKTEDPNGNGEADEIPFGTFRKMHELNSFILPAFGILSERSYVDGDKVVFGCIQPNYKAFIEYANKLWTEELMDPDTFTQDESDLVAKGKDNLVGMASHALPSLVYDVKYVDDITMEDESEYSPVLPALSSEVNPEKVFPIDTGINRGQFAITDKCEYPEAMIRWVDWLYSEEGSIFIHYGEEGDLWKFNDEGLREYILPEDDDRNIEEIRGGDITPDCGTPTPKWVRDETEGSWNDPFQAYRIREIDEKLFKYGQVPMPLIYNTQEEQKRLTELETEIGKYVESMTSKFVVGEATLEDYDKFVETLKKMGVDELTDLYQAAYDRWKQAK